MPTSQRASCVVTTFVLPYPYPVPCRYLHNALDIIDRQYQTNITSIYRSKQGQTTIASLDACQRTSRDRPQEDRKTREYPLGRLPARAGAGRLRRRRRWLFIQGIMTAESDGDGMVALLFTGGAVATILASILILSALTAAAERERGDPASATTRAPTRSRACAGSCRGTAQEGLRCACAT